MPCQLTFVSHERREVKWLITLGFGGCHLEVLGTLIHPKNARMCLQWGGDPDSSSFCGEVSCGYFFVYYTTSFLIIAMAVCPTYPSFFLLLGCLFIFYRCIEMFEIFVDFVVVFRLLLYASTGSDANADWMHMRFSHVVSINTEIVR